MTADYEHAKHSFRLISDNSPAIMLLIDPASHRIVAANKAAEDFYGWKRSALEKMSINDINSLSAKEIKAEMDNTRQSKRNYFRLEHRLANGEIRNVEVYNGKVEIDGKDYLHQIVHDITKHTQSEKKLKQNESNFSDIFQTINEGICYVTTTGQIISANRALLEIAGLPEERIVGHNAFKLVTSFLTVSNLKKAEPLIKAALTGKNIPPFELGYKDKTLEITTIFSPVTKRIIAFVRDITDRKKSEIDLNESKENFRLLLNQIPEALFLHKLDGTIVDYNQITLEKYGYTAGELLQLKTTDIDPDYKKRENQGLFWKELNQKKQLRFEARHMKKDGTIFPVEISLAPIEMKGKRYYLALAADITGRKQAEEALRESEKRFRSYIENAPDGVFIADENGRYVEVNQAACKITGYIKKELLQKQIPDLLQKSEIEKGIQHFKEVQQNGSARSEIGFVTKSGENRFWHVAATKLSDTR
ncbi:MAG: PAS domain S-box protein, partial [Bacteroidales bacterium]|nr:PAS domain S-box protein [Bacteroidales bacterium]